MKIILVLLMILFAPGCHAQLEVADTMKVKPVMAPKVIPYFRDSTVYDSIGRPIELIWINRKGKIDTHIKYEYRNGKIFYRRYYDGKGKLHSTVIGEVED
jgi:hypothetical protein